VPQRQRRTARGGRTFVAWSAPRPGTRAVPVELLRSRPPARCPDGRGRRYLGRRGYPARRGDRPVAGPGRRRHRCRPRDPAAGGPAGDDHGGPLPGDTARGHRDRDPGRHGSRHSRARCPRQLPSGRSSAPPRTSRCGWRSPASRSGSPVGSGAAAGRGRRGVGLVLQRRVRRTAWPSDAALGADGGAAGAGRVPAVRRVRDSYVFRGGRRGGAERGARGAPPISAVRDPSIFLEISWKVQQCTSQRWANGRQ
jgi:hypothetical protein